MLNADGRGEVFKVDTSGKLWHRYQPPTGAGGWSGWEELPGAKLAGPPSVILRQDNRLELFALGTDRRLKRQARGILGIWSPWKDLGGPVNGEITGDPSAVRLTDDRLRVYVRGTDDRLWRRTTTSRNGEDYSPWVQDSGGTIAGDPTALRIDNTIHLFVKGGDGKLWHKTDGGAASWATAGSPHGDGGTFTSDIYAITSREGLPDLFVNDAGKATLHAHGQRAQNGKLIWMWSSIAGDVTGSPVALRKANSAETYARFADGSIRHARAESLSFTGDWTNIGGSAASSPGGGSPTGFIFIVNNSAAVTMYKGEARWDPELWF